MKIASKPRNNLEILLVEDDADFREQVVKLLGVYNDISQAATMEEARAILKEKRFDVVLLDKQLPDGNGLTLIPEIKIRNAQTVVIVLTADSNFNLVQKCLDAGASDYIYKSENVVPDLLVRIPMAMGRATLELRSATLTERLKECFRYEIIGRSAAMAELRSMVQSLKGTLTPVLITGETGTGKELIARRLYAIEDQIDSRPFYAINCGAIAENLVESELFGHTRGAFTGAFQNKAGLFKLADGGDLFLDEIAELPIQAQIKLLRVLQEGEFSPIGDNQVIRTTVRVIAATNRPLENLVAQGKFREDLYFRLAVFPIKAVPLRERTEDIPDMVQFFLLRLADSRFTASADVLKYLKRQTWLGNIRELRNVIERAIIGARRRGSTTIEKPDIQMSLQYNASLKPQIPGLPKIATDVAPAAYQNYLENMEREYLQAALQLFSGNFQEAARHLGISKSTFFRRAAELGIARSNRDFQTTPAPRGHSTNFKVDEASEVTHEA